MVPRFLTPEQKEIRMNICADVLQNIENDPNIFGERNNLWRIMVFFSIGPRKLAPIHALVEPQFTKAKESAAEQIQI